MSTGVNQAITFSMKEVAGTCRMREHRIYMLLQARAVKPAVYGTFGAGRGHRFSAQQLYAFAAVASLQQSIRGCSPAYAKEVFDIFESMDDAALEEWRGGVSVGAEVDDRSEESISAWVEKGKTGPVFGNHGNPMIPSDQRTVKDMEERMSRVDEAIRLRKQRRPGSDRVSDIIR